MFGCSLSVHLLCRHLFLEPYDPEKIPVLMVHWILSSPLMWRKKRFPLFSSTSSTEGAWCRRYRRGREEDRGGRSSLGRASLTFSGRPPNVLPSKLLMASRASASSLIVTNAKPRGWPVSLSVTTLISVTLPNCSKIC
jgi:hypothetical protein